jgi:hypothetical protein
MGVRIVNNTGCLKSPPEALSQQVEVLRERTEALRQLTGSAAGEGP